jgi:hypothetical protein
MRPPYRSGMELSNHIYQQGAAKRKGVARSKTSKRKGVASSKASKSKKVITAWKQRRRAVDAAAAAAAAAEAAEAAEIEAAEAAEAAEIEAAEAIEAAEIEAAEAIETAEASAIAETKRIIYEQAMQSADLTDNILCTLAKGDLRHDFTVKHLKQFGEYSIPESDKCIGLGEDATLETLLGITREVDMTFSDKNLAPLLTNEYTCKMRIEYSDLIEKGFKFIAPGGEFFLVVDTATSHLADVFANASPNVGEPIFNWVQNRQVLFDPAGKMAPHTDRGETFLINNPNVRFCWEDTTAPTFSRIHHYPLWPNGIYPKYDNSNVVDIAMSSVNSLFYSKDTIDMALLSDERDLSYGSQRSNIIIDTNNPENNPVNSEPIVIMTKEMASRRGSRFVVGNYVILVRELRRVLDSNKYNIPDLPLNAGNPAVLRVRETIDKHHVVAKRLGDQGQALSCRRIGQQLKYKNPDDTFGTTEMTEQCCFVTYDRMAMCGALLYRVPIVLFQYYSKRADGAAAAPAAAYSAAAAPAAAEEAKYVAMFIHNSILSDAARAEIDLKALHTKYKTLIKEAEVLVNDYGKAYDMMKNHLNDDQLTRIYSDVRNKIVQILPGLQANIITRLEAENSLRKCELLYREFIDAVYRYVPVFKTIKNQYQDEMKKMGKSIKMFDEIGSEFRGLLSEIEKYIPASEAHMTQEVYLNLAQYMDIFRKRTNEIRNLKDSFDAFISTCNRIKRRNNIAPNTNYIEQGNIAKSALYSSELALDSNFTTKAAADSLSEYIHEIETIILVGEGIWEAREQFFNILRSFLVKGSVIARNKEYFTRISIHLNFEFGDLAMYSYVVVQPAAAAAAAAMPINSYADTVNAIRQLRGSGGTKKQKTSQMTVQTFANIMKGLRREAILRSVFAILYALWSSEDETNTILPIRIENDTKLWSRDEVHKKLISLYDKFQTSQTGSHEQKMEQEKQIKQDIEMAMKEKEEEGTQPYIDYIPYIERQVKRTKHEGLLAMYNNLLGESEIVIPSDINRLLDNFLKEGVTYKNFFYGKATPTVTTNKKVSGTKFVSKGKVYNVAKTMTAKRLPSIKTHTLPSAIPMFNAPTWFAASAASAAAGGRHPLRRTRKQQRKQSRSKTYKNHKNKKNQKTRKNQKK